MIPHYDFSTKNFWLLRCSFWLEYLDLKNFAKTQKMCSPFYLYKNDAPFGLVFLVELKKIHFQTNFTTKTVKIKNRDWQQRIL